MPLEAGLPFALNGKGKTATLRIDRYQWIDNGYRPSAKAELCYDRDALYVRLSAGEKEPLAKALQDDGAIWCDSCLECFLQPFPEDPRYLNLETNSLGCMIFGIGTGRKDRRSLVKEMKPWIGLQTSKTSEGWGVSYRLPFDLLRKIYGRTPEQPISAMRANFYKCGDETPQPHFGMWSPIDIPQPDFHRPEYFGTLVPEGM